MSELINGRTAEEIKAAIRDCENRACKDCPYYADCLAGETRLRITKDALALIERLETARPRWISVEERLPEKECKVLVYIGACNITQGWYLGDGVFEVGIGAKFNVKSAFDRIVLTHWMTLPEPPKGADK